ncbi:RNA-binding protein [Bordetella genomosp. 9]|uniref:RNA-binding protein n=1 Tax=Bordetella genomosp. 9 TaxID=1416803 RepID=A0A261RPH1_9BORD|nr:ASCH domain-containing protein [Bordetella genomosp. 9]OZI26677.1 RNA-binding protein [Bordetella genomosp. 9]
MADLTLSLKGEYFDAIKAGTKTEEYRLCTPYWKRRLTRQSKYADSLVEGSITVERCYDRIILTRGYPKRDDQERRLILPWRGYTIQTITHPHFGPEPVQVYAIEVRT